MCRVLHASAVDAQHRTSRLTPSAAGTYPSRTSAAAATEQKAMCHIVSVTGYGKPAPRCRVRQAHQSS
jgi:hypothetical protein